jgi:peptide deformylase
MKMILPILIYGHKNLRIKAVPIKDFQDPALKELILNMWDTLHDAQGLGLAATQVGSDKRLFILDLPKNGETPALKSVFINPEILKAEGEQFQEEGCLSLPGLYEKVIRPASLTIRAQNIKGEYFEMTGDANFSRAFSHELDHLDGKLFVDMLSPFKRLSLLPQLKQFEAKAAV